MRFRIIRLESTDSTMKEAAGHPPGTVIVAERQTAGQGRLGRSWHSEPGTGLYVSIVLEPVGEAGELPVITLALGLAAQEAVQNVAGVTCDLRWPNDLLIGEKKCAGILVQLEGDTIIAGVGVNVNHASFPDDLAGTATSLRLATGRAHSREKLLAALLDAVESYTALLGNEGPEAVLRLFARASSYIHGRRVRVGRLTGVTDGLDPTGFLWLREESGRRHLIRSGGLRPY